MKLGVGGAALKDDPAPAASPPFRLGHQPGLDGLRGIAVLLVVATHASILLDPIPWLKYGPAGVDLFFVLSGFLICSILLDEHESTGTISLRSFYRRRVFRLFPALWVMLLIALTIWATIPNVHAQIPSSKELLGFSAAMTYWFNLLPVVISGSWMYGTPIVWSLSIEEQFYLFFPLLLIGLLKRRRLLVPVLLGLAVISIIACGWVFLTNGYSVAYTNAGTRMFALLIGALAAIAYRSGHVRQQWVAPLAVAGSFYLAYVVHNELITNAFLYDKGGLAGLALAGAALTLAAVVVPTFKTVLSFGPLRYLGRISYSLYLWHYLVFLIISQNVPLHGWQLLVVGVAAALVAALGSYYLVELPFLRMRKWFERRPTTRTSDSIDTRKRIAA